MHYFGIVFVILFYIIFAKITTYFCKNTGKPVLDGQLKMCYYN